MSDRDTRVVVRRRVFYIPGYDPFPPRRYRELYRVEAAAQARISGYEIALDAGSRDASCDWHVRSQIGGQSVQTDFHVLVWSDIVRASMRNTIFATYAQLLRTVWIYLSTGTFWRLMRLRQGPAIAALYPVAMLLAQLAVALLVGGAVARGLDGAIGGSGPGPWMQALAAGAGIGAAVLLLRWFRASDGRLFAHYLMHDYAFSSELYGDYPPELVTRMRAFAGTVAAALRDDVDEVLLVGHSSGAHLGVSILADVLRGGAAAAHGPALSFLCLGQVMPMLSFLPQAHRLRADLQFLSERPDITWVDVTAPGDGCSFALCDPVAVSGVARTAQRWPLVLSAAFSRTLSPDRWRALRWRFFRLHFQYLCAFDRPGDYDYFQITAGPLTLADRYAGRLASTSRLTRAISKYTSVAA